MTPHEVCNPCRRLKAQRRIAIENLAGLRAEFPRPKPEESKRIEEAKERVTHLQNAKEPDA